MLWHCRVIEPFPGQSGPPAPQSEGDLKHDFPTQPPFLRKAMIRHGEKTRALERLGQLRPAAAFRAAKWGSIVPTTATSTAQD
jgi:hypothetical protein